MLELLALKKSSNEKIVKVIQEALRKEFSETKETKVKEFTVAQLL